MTTYGPVALTATQQRRVALLRWLKDREALTAAEISQRSGLYRDQRYPSDRCFDDLKSLWAQKRITRLDSLPAKWVRL